MCVILVAMDPLGFGYSVPKIKLPFFTELINPWGGCVWGHIPSVRMSVVLGTVDPKLKYLFTKSINPCGVGTKSQVIEANIIDHITRFSSYVV